MAPVVRLSDDSVRSGPRCARVGAVSTIPGYLRGLVDDAAVFPPGNAPLEEAVAAHPRHPTAPYVAPVGPLVVGDRHLPHLPPPVEDDTHRGAEPPALPPVGSR